MAIDIDKMDGRRARGLRTRDAIVSALLDLIADGEVSPTAHRIANRAGVSVRSVYQHFADVEGLYADAAERTYRWARESVKDVSPDLTLDRRVDAFVDGRAAVLEALLPFHRAVRLMEPSSERVRSYRMAMERWERDRVATLFAEELRSVEGARRSTTLAALDAMTSQDTWDHLRRHGLSARAARQVLRSGILCLLPVG